MLVESILRNYTSVKIKNSKVIYQQARELLATKDHFSKFNELLLLFYKNTKSGFPDKSFFGFLETSEDICLIIFCSTFYEKSICQLASNALFA